MKIKICGITNFDDGLFAAEHGADYLGFIFYSKSPRYIDPVKSAGWITKLEKVRKVGVFVNEDIEGIMDAVKLCNLDVVQLHGDETVEDILVLQDFGIEVWKVFSLKCNSDVETALASAADRVLVDSVTTTEYGGTGKVCDWHLAAELAAEREMVLAGGLNPDNVAEAVSAVHPYALDVSSGVEQKPGKKDLKKLEAFLNNASSAFMIDN